MEETSETLRAARDAYAAGDWAGVREAFADARERGPLTADDLLALGDAAWWLGDIEQSLDTCEEAYRLHLRDEELHSGGHGRDHHRGQPVPPG